MTETTSKESIGSALRAFSTNDFSRNSLTLFSTLGYKTERRAPLSEKTFKYFKSLIESSGKTLDESKFYADEWKYVDFLFQLTKEDLSNQVGLFDNRRIDNTIVESYLFLAIELSSSEYSRTALAKITRQVNRVFSMPVMILFKYGDYLTLSVIDRRINKKDESKDVLEKVTLIKDISIEKPHRAHIEILHDLSLGKLREKFSVTNFVELHRAWLKILDTKELNRRFYSELSNWYFWAMNKVEYPDDIEKDSEIRNSVNLIRLLTRIIFVWFIKEKRLIPERIFVKNSVNTLLKEFFDSEESCSYYKAILQNLFFAILNQKMGERAFAKNGSFHENKTHYGVKSLLRYSELFKIEESEVLELFKEVPFLNGGLFDCLDITDINGKVHYIDGFSRNSNKQAFVPDYLFFSEETNVDLNEIYGTTNKTYRARGLIEILSSYKFTIAENTPVEEEVALDPELLGRVFENLLASYNPETQTTARKQTGSFYTPREIVNYMVDESLKYYLKQKLEETGMSSDDAEVGLDFLIGYNEKGNPFNNDETQSLIKAIDNCKILDPACGSGAFPMGILHKLVHILHKLDPDNAQWEERQIRKAEKIEDPVMREQAIEDIENAFLTNELDYGRKLFLIENCIHGVDIQPIAVQISKLRFFISLVVDQKKDPQKENMGILSLPNLETKFVAANSLLGLNMSKQMKFKNPEIIELENKLKRVRHMHFSVKTRKDKLKYQDQDKLIRENIAALLEREGWDKTSAKHISAFDPYDQNASSPFFDPEWMFGVNSNFDIVIGNPPYVRADSGSEHLEFRRALESSGQFKTLYEKWDLMIPFMEKGLNLLSSEGSLIFIVSNAICTSKYASKLLQMIQKDFKVLSIDFFEKVSVFDAGVIPVILHVARVNSSEIVKKIIRRESFSGNHELIVLPSKEFSDLGIDAFRKTSNALDMKTETVQLGDICYMSVGMVINADEKTAKGEFGKDDLISPIPSSIHIKPYIEGKDIDSYVLKEYRYLEWGTTRVPSKLRRKTFEELYSIPKLMRGRITGCIFDENGLVCNDSIVLLARFCDLKHVNNKSISSSIKKHNSLTRNVLEQISSKFDLKYLLAVMNSRFAFTFLNSVRRHRLENYFYPDDFRKLPIADISISEQKEFVKIVDNIISITGSPGYMEDSALQSQVLQLMEKIDKRIYETYRLSDTDITVIEQATT